MKFYKAFFLLKKKKVNSEHVFKYCYTNRRKTLPTIRKDFGTRWIFNCIGISCVPDDMKTLKHECKLRSILSEAKRYNGHTVCISFPPMAKSTEISSIIKILLENTARQLVHRHSIRCLKEINR